MSEFTDIEKLSLKMNNLMENLTKYEQISNSNLKYGASDNLFRETENIIESIKYKLTFYREIYNTLIKNANNDNKTNPRLDPKLEEITNNYRKYFSKLVDKIIEKQEVEPKTNMILEFDIYGFKIVYPIHSLVLNNMLYFTNNTVNEFIENESNIRTLQVKSLETCEDFIYFIYTGSIKIDKTNKTDKHRIPNLLEIADFTGNNELMSYCDILLN